MWTYSQRTGNLRHNDGDVVATGYAGIGVAKNDPSQQDQHDRGPLPRGFYIANPPYTTQKHGPYTMSLTPDPHNEMFGRSGFMMHGDSIHDPGNASDGCIVQPLFARHQFWDSGDHKIEVIE